MPVNDGYGGACRRLSLAERERQHFRLLIRKAPSRPSYRNDLATWGEWIDKTFLGR